MAVGCYGAFAKTVEDRIERFGPERLRALLKGANLMFTKKPPLLVCRYCGPRELCSAGPIRVYTCPDCVKQEREVIESGGRFD